MGFDLGRAVSDTLSGQTSIVDRLVSYLYFSDIAVLEQSTWDAHGPGVSVIGTKGDGGDPALVFATPLPLKCSRGQPSWQFELACFCDLIAKTWAISNLNPRRRPIHLVAYRPDAISTTFREIIHNLGEVGEIFVWGPVGPTPTICSGRLALIKLDHQSPPSKRRLHAQAVARRTFEDVAKASSFMKAFELAIKAFEDSPRSGFVRPARGSSLLPPWELELSLSSTRSAPAKLRGFTITESGHSICQSMIPISSLLLIWQEIRRIRQGVLKLWRDRTSDLVWPVSIDNDETTTTVYVAVVFPPDVHDDKIVEQLSPTPRQNSELLSEIIQIGAAVSGTPSVSHLACATALSLATDAKRLVMGPSPAEATADPMETTRRYACAYHELLKELL